MYQELINLYSIHNSMQTLVMTLPVETSTNREYSLKCSVTQDAFSGFASDAITIVPTEGGDEKVRIY